MGKVLSAVGAAVVGIALAGVSAWAVYTSNTKAPSTNPAGNSIVQYGER